MANVVIADICNMRCGYCFARQHLDDARSRDHALFITPEDLEARLDFLDRSGIEDIRLIGGEPTLHPRFPELVDRAMQRGKHITVFSHGLMPEPALASLERLPLDRCAVLINTNATRYADGPSDKEQARRRNTMTRLGLRAIPGFTIFSPTFSPDFLIGLILDTGCSKSIRFGLAQPILQAENKYLHPKQYPQIGRRLAQVAEKASQYGIRLELDCGFVRCMFSDADLDTLKRANADLEWHCSAILDIGMDGQAIHCFPLSGNIHLPVDSTTNAAELRATMTTHFQLYRAAGIYKECSTCPIKQRGECTGGCLAVTMRRFRQPDIHVTVDAAILGAGHS